MTKYDFLIFRLLRLKTPFQVEQHDAYKLGPPLEPINLGIEEPKPGDIAITAVHTCTELKLDILYIAKLPGLGSDRVPPAC